MIQVEIVGVRIEMPSNQPLVLLKERLGERHIPIWIGASEATAIALAEQGVVPPRPLTHDLLCGVVLALGHRIVRANLTKVEDGVFYAELVFDDGTTVGSRASDAIAVAQRADCGIWASEALVEEAGVIIVDHDDDATTVAVDEDVEAKEREVRQFREFLNGVEPEDFDK
ncbi:bifunctional DNase/RNase [Arthrobacter silviterrae]|uniref:Bifunctional nuclease family protein n=1 Tax=Arthrobacter silviterrae TaxID=2026658 RepID=A0ABX0DCQ8_9MICC|nr:MULTISPECIES: bifunctional nuclease family protein [Arthrobacter]MCU6479160.1 bifunctional nuclease family protein [Arthrobacter sp. A2-55]MDQ0275762.1 bifunctional DNase/RNase [Arthrobacter silviterrae]NGN83139.1 bifunctional nuclease family protein [Arthrobacter silviterrae]